MRTIGVWLAAAALFAGGQAQAPVAKWTYWVVSTPDFDGAFRGNSPGFQPPVDIQVKKPERIADGARVAEQLEVIVGADGKTTDAHALASASRQSDESR